MEARAKAAFVGRAGEFGKLEHALETARAGSGVAALVAGEAGIGKTRLVSELARRARDAGFDAFVGRSIDLVGTELPYQPFIEALRPLGGRRPVDGHAAGSQLQVFEETLALLTGHAVATPVLLVLEDCTGPIRQRSISSSSSPTTSPTARFCCSRPIAPASSPRPSACAGSPTASGARAQASCSNSARSITRS